MGGDVIHMFSTNAGDPPEGSRPAPPAAVPDQHRHRFTTYPAAMPPPQTPLLPANDAALFADRERRRGGMRCPHCLAVGNRRTSAPVTPLYWDLYYACSNLACGHTWKASLTYEYGLSPSACPDPALDLPLRTVSRDDVLRETTGPPEPDPNQPRLFGD